MNLYAEYLKEREDKELLYTNDYFVVYEILKNYIYLQDMYIRPEKRGNRLSKKLLEDVCNIGKNNSCNQIITSACLKANNFDKSFYIIKSYGFEAYKKDEKNGMIYFIKGI